jgi:uncharacterized protein
MSLGYHQLSTADFDSLAAGGGGQAAIEALTRAQHSKHALLLHSMATAAGARHGYDLLARAQRNDAAAATAVIRYPAVGAWAYRTVMALRGGPRRPGATPNALAAVGAAAAIRAGLAAEIDVPVRDDGLVMLPSLGAVSLDTDETPNARAVPQARVATVRIAASSIEVIAADVRVVIPANYHDHAPGWRPLRPVLTDPFELVVDEVDPFRMPSAPGLGAAADLGPWRSAFREAWGLLNRHHPAVAADVAAVIKVAVPLAPPPHGQVSCSSSETFGAIALSRPLDPCGLAVTLAHEVQHMKLSALLELVPLTRPDDGSVFYAPWRDDPRPASGLLQGAYAYLGVTGFWRRQREITRDADAAMRLLAHSEFARWRESAALASRVLLASGLLTEDGAKFVRGMAATLRAWQYEPVPERARRLAAEKRKQHMAHWRSLNPSSGERSSQT